MRLKQWTKLPAQVALPGAVIFATLGIYALVFISRNAAFDFRIYAAAAYNLVGGGSAYFPYNIGTSFVYHPAVLSGLSLLLPVGGGGSFIVWTLASALAYAALIVLVARAWGKTIAFLLLIFAPALETLWIGQINIFAALALVAAWKLAERNRDGWAGAALAAAIILKTSPALLLLYFVARRRWTVVTPALFTLALLTLIPLLQFGVNPLLEFIAISTQTGIGADTSNFNLSPLAVLARAGLPFAEILHRLILVGSVGGLMVAAYRRSSVYVFALFCLVMIGLSPLVWLHHFVFVVAVLALLPYDSRLMLPISLALLLIQAERFAPLPGIACAAALLIFAWALLKPRREIAEFR